MARFWSRVIQPFRAAPIDIKKKKLPVVAIHEYVKLITVQHILKDSIIYSKHLVRVEQLEKAYNQFKQKKYHWKQVDPFVQVWYEELERVCQQGQVALTLLQAQLEDLSHTLHDISSPLKNRNPHSLRKAREFIDSSLKQWQTQKPWLDDPYTDHSLEQRELVFQAHYQNLEHTMQQALHINKQSSPKLGFCIRNLYACQKDLCLFSYYLSTQFATLFLFLKPLHHYETVLLQVLHTRLRQKHAHQHQTHRVLIQQMQQTLSQCLPPPRDTLTCAVCLCLLKQPITLSQCGHTFCRGCIQRVFCAKCHDMRNRRVQRLSQSLLLRRRCVPVVYCLCNPEKKRACPLCRALFDESDCVKDEALNLTMNVYYRASDEEVEEEKEKRKSRPGRASRIVSGMQRWSHRLGESSMIQDSISAHQDMVALARRSWMF